MNGLGQSILEKGIEKGRLEEREKNINKMILWSLNDHLSADDIIQRVHNFFDISLEVAEQYYKKFAY